MTKLYRFSRFLFSAVAGAGVCGAVEASAVYYAPSPYLSAANSPFSGGAYQYLHLENFEDGLLNTPGASASAGWRVSPPDPFNDSVDSDDGSIDGSGTLGHSYYSGGNQASLTITFDAAQLGGRLPDHAGIVWTDVGRATPSYYSGPVSFEAYDANGLLLSGFLGPYTLGDGNSASGTTAEDRFLGVFNSGGISKITISMSNSTDWEVDHLQYGASAVPVPGALWLLGSGLAALGLRRRRP